MTLKVILQRYSLAVFGENVLFISWVGSIRELGTASSYDVAIRTLSLISATQEAPGRLKCEE